MPMPPALLAAIERKKKKGSDTPKGDMKDHKTCPTCGK